MYGQSATPQWIKLPISRQKEGLHSGTKSGSQKKRNDWESSQLCENVEGHEFARSHQVCKTMSPAPFLLSLEVDVTDEKGTLGDYQVWLNRARAQSKSAKHPASPYDGYDGSCESLA